MKGEYDYDRRTDEERIFADIMDEFDSVRKKYQEFISEHEGYVNIANKLDKLYMLVKVNQDKRDRAWREEAYKEAKQIGVMAARFMLECCDERKYKK